MKENLKSIIEIDIKKIQFEFEKIGFVKLDENNMFNEKEAINYNITPKLLEYEENGNSIKTYWYAIIELLHKECIDLKLELSYENYITKRCEKILKMLENIKYKPFKDNKAFSNYFTIKEMQHCFYLYFYINPDYVKGFECNGILD